jgi:hypothetical protein
MEERLASRFEAMLSRQCDNKRLMIEETEMNQPSVKRPRIESATLTGRNTAQVEVGEKEDKQLRSGERTMFSMFNPFRKSN